MLNKKTKIKNFIILSLFIIIILASTLVFIGSVEASSQDLNDEDEMNIQTGNYIIPAGNTFNDIQNAIFSANDGDTIYLNNLTYIGNGDNIIINKPVHISGSTVNGNEKSTLNGNSSSIIMVIESIAENIVISNCVFINGENVDAGGGAIFILSKNVTVENSDFMYNHAKGGGAIYTHYEGAEDGAGDDVIISKCNFINNTAIIAAGAVGAYGNNTKIIDCYFINNQVINNQETTSKEAYGGALQLGMAFLNTVYYCINSVFINNSAITYHEGYYSHGGATCVRDGDIFLNCTFINNSASEGGALTSHADFTVENCSFYNNFASELFGGAIATRNHEEMEAKIYNCIFNDNYAPIGGAVYLTGKNIEIVDNIFNNNLALKSAGAVYIKGNKTVIKNSFFNENIANVNGGAVFIEGKDSYIYNNTFLYNEAIPNPLKINDGLGGAIFINGSEAVIEINTFKFNTARNGSAIYFDKSGEKIIINDNIMFNNQAWVYLLPILTESVYYGEDTKTEVIIHGGNNIGNVNNLEISNAIFNGANYKEITVNHENPVYSATDSGILYQDSREYNVEILLTITHENGECVFNETLNSSVFGNISVTLSNLKVGKYHVTATHFEDTYYKYITNISTFDIIPKVDLEIKKNISSEYINYLDTIIWTLTVVNNGPNQATNVIVNEKLVKEFILLNDTSNGKYNPNTGIWNIGTLNSGENVVLELVCLVNFTGSITNFVNISSKEHDWNLSNNEDFETINVNKIVDLEILKTVSNNNPKIGDTITWSLTVVNNGPNHASGIIVKDLLSEGLVFISDDSGGKYDYSSGIWSINELAIGKSITLNIICLINKTGFLENFAVVSGGENDPDLSNNNDSEIINVNKVADLSVIKSVSNSNPNLNDLIIWTITIQNNGPSDASGVNVFDILPQGLIYQSDDSGGSYNHLTGLWNIGILKTSELKTLKIISLVNKTGEIENLVSINGNEYDSDLSNNNDSKITNVNKAADLIVTKIASLEEINIGDIFTYTITILNNGPDDAENIELYDILDSSLKFLDSFSDYGFYDVNLSLWKIDSLKSGKSIDLILKVQALNSGSILNSVKVSSSTYDPYLSNNQANVTVIVREPLKNETILNLNEVNKTHVEVKEDFVEKNNISLEKTGNELFLILILGFLSIVPFLKLKFY
ncbi:DUF11 domain-containing protein [Methanobrevibacter sp. OttesenSCG-928-K11]|nr:DUF11 domain-containing protein [Methanobrevibacter sp. OttesenSCG-928-K11]MDL2270511.1 DUF11 domain-containing protein [Methanobrevibacter sp. OttesenSCG-928-I08]